MEAGGHPARGGAFRLVLEDGPPDMLGLVLAQFGARSLLRSVSLVSRLFAACAEPVLQSQCEVYGWRLPKSSRLAFNSDFPWRALYAARSCRECASMQGDFAIRRWKHAPEFYRAYPGSNMAAPCRHETQPLPLPVAVCGRCCKAPLVVRKLQERKLTLDVTGLSGKPLYTKRADSFSAAVSASSGDALATANGARAERQRRSGRGR